MDIAWRCKSARTMITPIALGITLLFVVVGTFQKLGRYIYSYRLASDTVQVVLFGAIPVTSIGYSEIVDVREVTFRESLKPSLSLRLGNRLVGNLVLIQKTSGLIRSLLLTPDDAPGFAKKLREHLTEGQKP
jgi:hypothetical protein